MRSWTIGLAFLSLSILCFVISRGAPTGPAPSARGKDEVHYVPGEILIKFRPGVKSHDRGRVRGEADAATKHVFKSGAEHWRLGPGVSVEDAVERLKKNPLVEYAEPNYILKADLVPNDPYYYSLHGLDQIRATQAWNISRGSADVVVGVLDTGVDYNHPDLADNIWTNPGEIPGNHLDDDGNGYVDDVHGYDFVNDDNDPFDDTIFFAFGHGTHVSGIIGAAGDNSVGIAGVNWRVSIMPLKVLDASGSGAISGIVSAIDYAARMGAGITNNSYGGYVPYRYTQTVSEAISRASDRMLFVAAAGNESTNIDAYPLTPASFDLPNIVSVAATDYAGQLAYFSNYGLESVDLGAPGVGILSTVPGNLYEQNSGTSMATPHVTGAAALLRARFPSLSVEQLKAALLGSVDPAPTLSGVTVSGGRLNAFAALGGTQDSIAPERITNLTASNPGSSSVVLTWTATGDDGSSGTAGYYDVRYSTSPLDESNFAAATRTGNEPAPLGSGSIQTMEVGGLDPSMPYYFAIKAFDDSGNPGPLSNVATGPTLGPPRVGLAPAILEVSVPTRQRLDTAITLRNDAEGTLDFTIPLPVLGVPVTSAFEHLILGKGEPDPRRGDLIAQRAGGPDPFGYRWTDSDEQGGPQFEWIEISETGTPIPIAGDDLTSDPIPLGFGFPLYGSTFNSIRVCTNGFLSFTSNSAQYFNEYLPSFFAPENLVAAFWDDLSTSGSQARIYYQTFGNRVVVEWNAVPHFCCGGPYTFETILDSSGAITFQYLRLAGNVTGATVGIQNANGTMGLQVAFNQPYLHDNLAIRLLALPQWLTTSPKSGRIAAGGSLPITVHLDARGLEVGAYPGAVNIQTNDPLSRLVAIPVSLTVLPDSDYDGVGDPADDCPNIFNPQQEDADRDRVGDFCDPCTDSDGDGLGDPGFVHNTCPEDDCPSTHNPHQDDLDGDRIGDVCDRCPLDPLNDADGDDKCADVDNCPAVSNPGQDDSDDDSAGDPCDNCATISNPDQADTNRDGSGDECQPSLTLVGIRSIGSDTLEATVEASDPQSDSLTGTVEILETEGAARLMDLGMSHDCGQGYFPEGVSARGIGFAWRSYGSPLLFDFNLGAIFFGLGCVHDPSPDYLLHAGRCDDPSAGSFSVILDLSALALPAPICLGKLEAGSADVISTLFDVVVEAYDPDSIDLSAHGTRLAVGVPFSPVLPQSVNIASLVIGPEHRLIITVTDGTTVPVAAEGLFAYAGESRLILVRPNTPPQATISAATTVECTSPNGGLVTLDGSASTDSDSTPGTNDDIVSYEWFLNFGQPSQETLGTGRILTLTLPIGPHAITLSVTDSRGATSTAEIGVSVRDTTPPALTLALDQTVLWPPNHRLVLVHVAWQASDLCDTAASVALVSVASNEPDDAPGDGDGRTTGDVDGVDDGTPDREFLLRAERSGAGTGRSYTVVYRSLDAAGNSADTLTHALVPHDLNGVSEPLTLSLRQTGAGAEVAWNPVVAALFYNVVRGDVRRLKEERDVIDLGPVVCLVGGGLDTTTSGHVDREFPASGDAYFYVVTYDNGWGSVGYGTASVSKPRVASSGNCTSPR